VNSTRSRSTLLIAGLLAAVGIGAGIGATAVAVLSDDGASSVVREVTVTDSEPTAAGEALSIGSIYRDAVQGVVEISARGGGTFGGGQQSQGSGFVYDAQGHIVTNEHVVHGTSSITVRFSDGSTRDAALVGTDRSTDLAVIKVDAPASFLTPLRLGDSDDVLVGDGVVAMGSPFGLEGTITSGIVSALHRQITAPNRFTINGTIQTDAAVNHGNSGGPLLNDRGRVIGVNAQIESESGGSDGVGFAIPSNTVRSVVTQILQTGEAEHAYLGVTLVELPEGVALAEIREGGPADDAGLRGATGQRVEDGRSVPTGGDLVVEFEGREITTTAQLQNAVSGRRPGDTVTITVLRGGDRETIEVTLGEQPENP
jgi:putative serine protease PepD